MSQRCHGRSSIRCGKQLTLNQRPSMFQLPVPVQGYVEREPNRIVSGEVLFLSNKKIPLLIALPPVVQHGFSAMGLCASHLVHLPFPHFNLHSSSQFRFFWPSEAPGRVFLSQAINSSPKKINALKRKLGAFLTKYVLERKIDLLLIGF